MTDLPTAKDGDTLLAIYLRDHRAGAEAGLALAGRCRRANEGTQLGGVLAGIETEIAEDRAELAGIMERLGVGESQLKKIGAKASEVLARLKSNGRIWPYSPSSRVLELEGLMAGIDAKRNLWSCLRTLAHTRVELDVPVLDGLIARATSQHERLAAEHDHAVAAAFAGVK